jgi:hypothetical protein
MIGKQVYDYLALVSARCVTNPAFFCNEIDFILLVVRRTSGAVCFSRKRPGV